MKIKNKNKRRPHLKTSGQGRRHCLQHLSVKTAERSLGNTKYKRKRRPLLITAVRISALFISLAGLILFGCYVSVTKSSVSSESVITLCLVKINSTAVNLNPVIKEFATGKIGEICHTDGGGEKRIFFMETSEKSVSDQGRQFDYALCNKKTEKL